MRIETKILTNLIHNEEYTRKVIPFIKPEYFQDRLEKVIIDTIITFFNQYNKLPTQDIIDIELGNRTDITDKELSESQRIVSCLNKDNSEFEWLINNTEKFCKDKAVYNAILQGIKIIDGKDDKLSQEAIPKILSDALAVSFDTKTGHDYLNDIDSRYEFYHRVEEKVPFDLEMMNKITEGGLSNKTLSVVLAGVNAGKSLFMCHVAASSLIQGKNVLYITMEMSENKIAQRIDANLLNIPINQIKLLDYDSFNNRVSKISKKTQGKLIIKEYPTASAHSGHFRALLEELKIKQDFSPDILIIDYLNICCSARMKMGSSINSYTYVKSIAEEIRGLAVEYDIPILSATQATRSGINNSDLEMTDTSESIGLPATCDMLFALIRSEELDQLNQVMIKQLKSRDGDATENRRFVLGVDRAKMKLYDVESCAQYDISDSGQDDTPAFDKSVFGKRSKHEGNFSEFKF